MRIRSLVILSLLTASSKGGVITDPSQLSGLVYDYIIVGAFGHLHLAGTAGLTLANRLSENFTVLVLEAGGSDAGLVSIEAPFLAPQATPRTSIDWNFTVVPQIGLNNRVFPIPAGRVLGGSSSQSDYLIHQYGTNDDWNKIANSVGDQGWAWANMKQYVKKHEQTVAPLDRHNTTGQWIPELHSTVGALQISLPGLNQSTDAPVIATTTQLKEFPYNNETSGLAPSILGFGFVQSSISSGVRTTASTAYLTPVSSRVNLTILLNATARKLVQTGVNGTLKSFRAIQFSSTFTAPIMTVTARKDIILSAGGIGTPKILMLSGIGNSSGLTALKIGTLINNPSVGNNFMDSTFLPNFFSVSPSQATLDSDLQNQTGFADALTNWEGKKRGIGTIGNNIVNMFGFARLPPTASIFSTVADPASGPLSPHYEIVPTDFYLPIITAHPDSGNFMTFVTTLSSPTSRGTIKLNTSNPFDPPLIDPRYLTTDFDIFTMRESVRAVQRFISAPAWAVFDLQPFLPMVPASASNATVDAYIKSLVSTIFHPSGSAAMTSASHGLGAGVVNPDLTVKGADGLRVVDASIWPFYISTHPQGAVYLLAERAADIIKGFS